MQKIKKNEKRMNVRKYAGTKLQIKNYRHNRCCFDMADLSGIIVSHQVSRLAESEGG
jgi:hypothetical protein